MENFDINSISSMMNEVATANKEEIAKEVAAAPTSAPVGGYNRDNSDRPNIYEDKNINPKPVDTTKVKESKTYAIVAVDENPPVETIDVMMKIADILKAKKVVYRYDNSVMPSLPRDVFMKQDLTIPTAYQLFLPFYKRDRFDLEGMCTITNKWPANLAAQHAKHYSKITIKDKTDRTKILEEYYGFSKVSGGARNNMANKFHILLGKDCLTKLKFMILYSVDGCETMEDVKAKGYKEVSRKTQDTIRRCADFGIPVFNIGKQDGIKKLLELIQGLE